jgi:hypothetical protein
MTSRARTTRSRARNLNYPLRQDIIGQFGLRLVANDDDDPALLRRIVELFTTWQFLGSRRMTAMPGRGPCG